MTKFSAATSTTAPPVRTIGPITQTDMVRYQGASGDFNPLHHDAGFAFGAGFERPVIVGMYMAGLIATWVGDWHGPESIRRLKVRFRRPAFVGDVLEIGGEIADVGNPDGDEIDLALWCRRPLDGLQIVSGWATCRLNGANDE